MDARKLTAFLMLDYLRLELTGYVPPAPSRVTAYAGNNRTLVCWPLVPGATSYNVLRSTSRDGRYAPVATGFIAPVYGSGPSAAQYVDTTAANGSEYFYKVQSVNPVGASQTSPASAAAAPSPERTAAAPPAPVGLKVTGSGHHRVALTWAASPGASFYRIWRSTLTWSPVTGATGYVIYRSSGPAPAFAWPDHYLAAVARTTYVDPGVSEKSAPVKGLDPARAYDYEVRAVNPAGVSPPATAHIPAR